MLTQEQIDHLVNSSREADEGPTAFVRRIEAAVRESIAKAWDGCVVDVSAVGEVDVGASIRAGALLGKEPENPYVVMYQPESNEEGDVYVARINGNIAITDDYLTDYVTIYGPGDWVRESSQLELPEDIREYLNELSATEAERSSASPSP